jgi:hypothetical protein
VGSGQVYRIGCVFGFGTAPNRRREQAQLCPINCPLGLAQPQLQKWARCSTAVFPKMFMFREKLSQLSPVPEDYNVTPPPPKMPLLLVLRLYIINSLEVEEAGVSPSKRPACLAPALCMFGLLSVVFSGTFCCPQLGF